MRKFILASLLCMLFSFPNLQAQLPAPNLTSPTTFSNGIPVNGQLFDWSDVSGAVKYVIQYSTDFNFSTNVSSDTVTVSEDTLNGLSFATQYYWHAQALDSLDSAGTWSFSWVFSTTGQAISAPTLIYPAANDTGIALSNVTLDWTMVASAISYEIWYANDNNFNAGLVIDTVVGMSNSQYTIATLMPSSTYFWKVSATSGPATSAFTQPRRFFTKDTILLASPAPISLDESWELYPSQNQGQFTVEFHSAKPISPRLTVLSMEGKVIWEKDVDNTSNWVYEMNLSHLPQGIYFMVALANGQRAVKRFMIE